MPSIRKTARKNTDNAPPDYGLLNEMEMIVPPVEGDEETPSAPSDARPKTPTAPETPTVPSDSPTGPTSYVIGSKYIITNYKIITRDARCSVGNKQRSF
jgi:hypothetical protein